MSVPSTIRILNGSSLPATHIVSVRSALEQQFNVSVELKEYWFDLDTAIDKPRGQYLSAALLRQMGAEEQPQERLKLIGLMDADLFAPVLTFVYGEAQLGGSCAILSTFRLHNAFYGIPPDEKIFLERVAKEAVHETGHLFGLIHCRTFDCVMRSSTYVEEIDLKSANICPACRKYLEIRPKS
jgi:archaemetzincin